MKLLVILLSTFALALGGIIPKTDDRIIGGKQTTIEEHPYQISLHYNGKHNCGGTIVNKNTIVTAAHCVNGYDYSLITIRVGSTFHASGEEYKVSQIFEHEDYNIGASTNNDIAILKLARPLTFSDKVQPVELQPADSSLTSGTTATVSGWGSINPIIPTYPEDLRAVDVDVISNEDCQLSYKGNEIITETMLCARRSRKDSCWGDSGGPLVAHGRLVGVVSWGYGCADAKFPGVYAKVSALREFVDKHL